MDWSAEPARPRFGVEEEFLIVDPVSRLVVPRAGAVLDRARQRLAGRVSGELTELQVEAKTEPCTSAPQLYRQLVEGRRVLDACARAESLRIAGSGSCVLSGAAPPPITQGPRQDRGNATYRALHREMAICALHVHVELPDRDHAVRVSDHLRPYLPILGALAANSPYWEGRDTGYASWRMMVWSRWPVAGPPPVLGSAARYDELVARLAAAGVLVDTGTVFWDVRPSAVHPTLEVRVGDTARTAADAVAYAALVRALVVALLERVDDEPPAVPEALLRAAYWQAARDGIDGAALDPVTGRCVPAAEIASGLHAWLRPRLEPRGEDGLVGAWLARLGAGGGGARRQRAAARAGGLAGVVDDLVAASVADDATESAHVGGAGTGAATASWDR